MPNNITSVSSQVKKTDRKTKNAPRCRYRNAKNPEFTSKNKITSAADIKGLMNNNGKVRPAKTILKIWPERA